MSQYIIDEIQPTAWRLRIRDESTGKTEEVALRPGEPWKVRVGAATKAKPEPTPEPAKSETAKPETAHAEKPAATPTPLPKDLKLSLENGSGNTVVATAHGRGAAAWAKTQKRLLGRKWEATAEGNPFVMLRNAPTLLEDLGRALPGIRLDTKHYTPPGAPPVDAPKQEKADEPRAKAEKTERPERTPKAESKPERAKDKAKAKKPGRKPKLQAGSGPGGLEWNEVQDAGNRAIVAPWEQGNFKILRAGPGVFALFYEYERGGYEQLACGKPDELKQVASARTTGTGQRVTEALARGACNTCTPPANDRPERTPKPAAATADPPEPAPPSTPPADPTPAPSDTARDAELMSGFRKELAGIFDEDDA